MSGKKHNVSQDVFGRDLSYLLSCHPALEQLNKIDLYSSDMESAYSPLHVCLRLGYLEKAYKLYRRWKRQQSSQYNSNLKNIWDLKDREGLTPIELYRCENNIWNYHNVPVALYPERRSSEESVSVVQWEPRSHKENSSNCRGRSVQELRDVYQLLRGGRELYTIGSNVNLQLGTGDSEDRQEPYKLDEYLLSNSNDPCQRVRFKAVIMKRYHSLTVTTEGQIFTAGSGSRGRLGNNDTNMSNVRHAKVDMDSHRVHQLDSSDHHSVVLTTSGDILTWGWNRYSQLGYSTPSTNVKKLDNSALENVCSAIPKKVVNPPWKKSPPSKVKFVACSKVHTCLIDDQNNFYAWGLNLGQMGTTKNYSEDSDFSYLGHRGWVISSPQGSKLPSFVQHIRQLFCTEFATFILSGENQLCVITNYKILSFSIPKTISKQVSLNQFDVFTPNSLSKKNRVVKIKTTHPFGNNICVLYESGAVGILQSNLIQDSVHGWSKLPNSLPITQYWIPYFGWNKCLDFDVGANGQLILCTSGGYIYKSNSASNPQFHRQVSNKLASGKSVMVSCDSLFSSFGIIRDDVDMIPVRFVKQHLYYDMSSLSPLSSAKLDSRRVRDYELLDKNDSDFIFDDFVKCSNNEKIDGLYLEEVNDNTEDGVIQDDILWKTFRKRWSRSKTLDYNGSFAFHPNQINCDDFNQGAMRTSYDLYFTDSKSGAVIAACHWALLEVRASLFTTHLHEFGYFTSKVDSGVTFRFKNDLPSPSDHRVIEVACGRLLPEALNYALHYMYTDKIPELSHILDPTTRKRMEVSTKAFMKLLDLHLSTFRGDQLPSALAKLLSESLSSKELSTKSVPDITIRLANGETLKAFSFMLESRCAFFESLFSRDWNRSDDSIKELFMEHVSVNEMTCILKYIHGLPFPDLFSHCTFDDYKGFVNFVLGVIQICDELMLFDLKHYLASILIDFIDASTVMVILVNAHRLFSNALIIECCWFIHNNIDLLFDERNSKIIEEHFDSELWTILQDFILEAKTRNRREFSGWYGDEGNANYSIGLFEKNCTKFNSLFMDNSNPFEPSFESRPHHKKSAGSKKSTDRRRSSNNQRTSLSQENLANVRRPSSSALDSKSSALNKLNFGALNKETEEAVEDDLSNMDHQGFVTVGKSRRKSSRSHKEHITATSSTLTSVGSSSVAATLNVVKFEAAGNFESTSDLELRANVSSSAPDRKSLFPELSSAIQVSSATESVSKVGPSLFSAVKKKSQKERMKIATYENVQDVPVTKKPVWGGGPSKSSSTSAQSTASVANKFPSITQSIRGQNTKRKSSVVGLTSTGESSTIPLYLSNTKENVPKPSRSLKEAIEEERFAKWWSQESEKVQEQLKKEEERERYLLNKSKPKDSQTDAEGGKKHSRHERARKPLHKRQTGAKAST
ncbi:LANO_0G17216g1_1 [Lachancea nothofagi CBS 11611]|uniref:LANO_0G17216g1_1 n=1 Tax=Lachancea nothofagi CBS 11611 TaxID=1266666 RepID=A0A1G4KKL9_9SACH|nr:LANO_0G17216g1_1 [Lachancea nothofagi CBS 11611]